MLSRQNWQMHMQLNSAQLWHSNKNEFIMEKLAVHLTASTIIDDCRTSASSSYKKTKELINKSLFSFLRQLTTWYCSQLLLSAGHAAIDQYLLPAGLTAANSPQRRAAAKWWDKHTDIQRDRRTSDHRRRHHGAQRGTCPPHLICRGPGGHR